MLSNVTFASRSMDLLPELFTISELMKRPREVIVVFTHIAFVAGVALDVAMARRRVMIIWHLTPELSRTAARNGGVVHVTMQPSREAVSA